MGAAELTTAEVLATVPERGETGGRRAALGTGPLKVAFSTGTSAASSEMDVLETDAVVVDMVRAEGLSDRGEDLSGTM